MKRLLSLLVLAWLVAAPLAAQEELYLEITRSGMSRVAMAAPKLDRLRGTPVETTDLFREVLIADLEAAAPVALVNERLYELVEPHADPEVLHQRWRAIGAQFLMTGSIGRLGGQLVVEVRLVELASGEYAFAKRYRASATAVRTLAHTLANDLVKVFTGRPGPFLSRIAFISDRSGSPELWVMDWDGSNPHQLTKHGSLALGPAWTPDGNRIAFTSFLRGDPALFLLKPDEGYLRMITSGGGVNSSASVSPDGRLLAFASSQEGNVDIWTVDIEGNDRRRLTTARAIDTQPTWAPNGRQLAFTSARSGTPQLYQMNKDGANVRRVTMDRGFYDEPTYAPDGLRLAATTKVDGRFQICTIKLAGGERTVIPGPGNNESPSFSPDGSMLAFVSDRTGTPQVYVTDGHGHPHQLTTEGTNHSPSWEPAP